MRWPADRSVSGIVGAAKKFVYLSNQTNFWLPA